MPKIETWLTALLWGAALLLVPMAAVAIPCSGGETAAAALDACADGSVQLAMGCASIQL
jgi:hypothetical protein